jgi:aldehyde:ferredoxin oxidoreductase
MECAEMIHGYAGKILNVDLTNGAIKSEPLDEGSAEAFIGGYGLGVRLLYDRIPAHADPLGPENVLAIMTGPLTGSGVPSGTRWTVCCKSPLTGTWGDANGSGFFGPQLKAAGYDGILFKGISREPVYLAVQDGEAKLLSAEDLWGLDTYAVDDALKSMYGGDSESVCIGPAGERLSLIAGVVHAKGRTAARSGVGAVMGSKRLKAIVVRGGSRLRLAQPEQVKALRSKYTRQILDGVGLSSFYSVTGTPGYIEAGVSEGDSSIRNWKGTPSDFTDVKRIGAGAIFALGRKKRSCWKCPIGCWGEVPLKTGMVHQPEYETASAFGSNLLVSDLETLLKCTDLCNRRGLDTISTAATIAFAVECFEGGLISEDDTGGLILRWGDAATMFELARQLADRQGFGATLADGTLKAVGQIGQGAERYAMHVGGQEIAMHDPRHEPGLGLVYVADATPGRHTQASQYIPPEGLDVGPYPGFGKSRELQEGRGRHMKPMACANHAMSASGLCLFGYLSTTMSLLPEWLTAVTGKPYALDQVLECGERIANLRQAFNVRDGFNLTKLALPGRIYGTPPLSSGPTKGITVDIQRLLSEHMEEMDWDRLTAAPSRRKLEALGLHDVAADLWGKPEEIR